MENLNHKQALEALLAGEVLARKYSAGFTTRYRLFDGVLEHIHREGDWSSDSSNDWWRCLFDDINSGKTSVLKKSVITIDGVEIKLSAESMQALRKQLCKESE